MGAYLESIGAAALICGTVMSFAGSKGTFHGIIKLLTGIFLVIAIVQPVLDMKISSIPNLEGLWHAEYSMAVEDGEKSAQKAMDAGIQERTSAYILEEARKLDCDLTVEVMLCEHIPSGVTIKGAVSPYAKGSLSQWIVENLNIPPEEQRWIG